MFPLLLHPPSAFDGVYRLLIPKLHGPTSKLYNFITVLNLCVANAVRFYCVLFGVGKGVRGPADDDDDDDGDQRAAYTRVEGKSEEATPMG